MAILSTSEAIAACLAFTSIALVYLVKIAKTNSDRKLPPGPKGVPFFGNLFQVDALKSYPKFREWAMEYGPIYRLKLGPQEVIVLNTAEAADELFVNRSKTFSSRSPPHVAHDIMSAGQRQVFLPYDREWKASRKSLQVALGPGASKRLRPSQDLESRVLLHDILQHGEQSLQDMEVGPNGKVPEAHWFSLVRRYTTSIVMTVAYGKRIHKILNNPRLHMIYEVLANFSKVAQPGNYLADAFPILRKLPDFLAKWRLEGRKMHEWEMNLWGGLLTELQEELNNGIFRDCYVSNYLRQRAEAGHEYAPGCGITEEGWLRDTCLAYSAGTVLEAGSDTIASAMQSLILFMISHPDIEKKVRDEIDRVVGLDRLPAFEDEPNLPYLVACIKETLRRRPPTIMGVPHSSDEDDVYEGYFIPKGSTVIGNIWAIHMDPKRYPNPFAFLPERWYQEGKPTCWGSGPDTERDHYIFGWGRRFCQGNYITEASLFIVLARIMWGIDFVLPRDGKTGNPVIPDINDEKNFSDGFVSTPYMYKLGFKARSEKHRKLIERLYEDSQVEWQALGFKCDER